jgi:hypothetical protein
MTHSTSGRHNGFQREVSMCPFCPFHITTSADEIPNANHFVATPLVQDRVAAVERMGFLKPPHRSSAVQPQANHVIM